VFACVRMCACGLGVTSQLRTTTRPCGWWRHRQNCLMCCRRSSGSSCSSSRFSEHKVYNDRCNCTSCSSSYSSSNCTSDGGLWLDSRRATRNCLYFLSRVDLVVLDSIFSSTTFRIQDMSYTLYLSIRVVNSNQKILEKSCLVVVSQIATWVKVEVARNKPAWSTTEVEI